MCAEGDTISQRRCRGGKIGTAAGNTDENRPVDCEMVEHLEHVAGIIVVSVTFGERRPAEAVALDRDHPQLELVAQRPQELGDGEHPDRGAGAAEEDDRRPIAFALVDVKERRRIAPFQGVDRRADIVETLRQVDRVSGGRKQRQQECKPDHRVPPEGK